MTTEPKHAPTPWGYPDKGGPIRDSRGNAIADTHGREGLIYAAEKENAAFIVRAVNSHDAMVEALEAARSAMLCGEPSKGNGCICFEGWMEVAEQARAALAKAKGE